MNTVNDGFDAVKRTPGKAISQPLFNYVAAQPRCR
jgi:hypothetical protein